MRPDILTMQAFGPYAGRETIDFNSLGERTMFVISGKTGAGKTTIFDGISFAIYGKASGEDRSGQDLRSQFAEDDILTEVSLQFTLRGKTYLVTRSPQQERKKKAGEGTTTVGAKAELYEILAEGKKLLGANVREVEEKIKVLIGLDANQFRQILMIPQNEFRKLLTSDSKDKEQILQKLFHTELYKRIEEKLKEEASILKKESEKSAQRRIELMKGIQPGNNEELRAQIQGEEPNEQQVLPLLQKVILQAAEKSEYINKQIQEKQKARDQVNQELSKAVDLLNRFSEKEKLRNEKEALEAKLPEMELVKVQIKMAHKAASLEKQEQYYLRIGKQVQDANAELQKLSEQSEKLRIERIEKQDSYDKEKLKDNQREQAVRTVHQLEQVKEAVMTFASLKAQVTLDEKEWQTSKRLREKTVSEHLSIEAETEKVAQEKTEAEKAAVLYRDQEIEAERNDHSLSKIKKLQEVLYEIQNTKRVLDEKNNRFQELQRIQIQEKEKLESLNRNWRSGQAGMLASMLHSGENCPVCGSQSHPKPAQLHEHMPTDLELKEQENKLKTAEQQKSQAESEYYQAKSKYDALVESTQEKLSDLQNDMPEFRCENIDGHLLQFVQKGKVLQEQLKEWMRKKSVLNDLEKRLQDLKEKASQLKDNMISLERKEDQGKTRYIENSTKLTGLTDSLPDGIRTEEEYNEAYQMAVNTQIRLQIAFDDAQKNLHLVKERESAIIAKKESLSGNIEALNTELKEEREKLITDMTNQGFSNYKEYTAAKKSEAALGNLEDQVQQYNQNWQSVLSLFHDLEMKLKDVAKPDLEGLKKTFDFIDGELESLRQNQNELQAEIRTNEEIERKLAQIRENQKSLDERYSIVGHLSEISKGQNSFKITFERYVLAAFLDDILKEANSRLLKMTSGRYQLLRKLDPTRRNIQSGLELSVYDQYTGHERHVKTLSGGESFKASLALALGLADVVQQNAGGISLETMFIDEGFGTLDPESLDHAIEALMDIQSTGRLVGIISHVPELKERIDAQLQVISTQNGSRTSFYFAG
ncbi:AAA family ATPase [Peribacillus simplex]|uniref:Nuclease SbcCD subunit C n=1 Tax=Peribacillus simplex TaxID=1478 RepID=A0A9W4L4B2_9BACI|nr:SbcC/MukB-like Walker B domain-containing protein [Peribacillus simplex]WHX93145.1 SbcC/MukB-like Walker B domain-containing protein [Peribacillus simplex]CAH0263300.1 Nuclease SbcCD subunit C [Peribacillus simplex]